VGFRLTLDDYCPPVGWEGARVGCVVTSKFCLGVVREQTGEGNLRGMKEGVVYVALYRYRYHAKSLSLFYTISRASSELNFNENTHVCIYAT